VTVLKPKATRRFSFRTGRRWPIANPQLLAIWPPGRQAEGLQPMTGTKITYLGTVALEPGERVALDIAPDMSPETIAAKIEAANAERVEAAKRESAALAEMFHLAKAEEPATPKPTPRDWLIP
jgi:hypothetical protein